MECKYIVVRYDQVTASKRWEGSNCIFGNRVSRQELDHCVICMVLLFATTSNFALVLVEN